MFVFGCRADPVAISAVIIFGALNIFAGPAKAQPLVAASDGRPLGGWFNLKAEFNAKGDGATDDTAALQRALDALGRDKARSVLFIPRGDYVVSRTLSASSRLGINVLGQSQSGTRIIWRGASGGTMAQFNGVAYSTWRNLTWDGAGVAGAGVVHCWDGKAPYAGTHQEHSDETFRDLRFGIRGGSGGRQDAETVVDGCSFINCSSAGVSVENFNALDWDIWSCHFSSCRYGVTNIFGAGNFHVFNSVFRGSTEADVGIGNLSYFSLRCNTSYGSKAFLKAKPFSAGALITLQGNRVYSNPGVVPVQCHNAGPLVCIDNFFSGQLSGGVTVDATTSKGTAGDLVWIGNHSAASRPVVGASRVFASPVVGSPQPPGALMMRPTRREAAWAHIVELKPGTPVAEIQKLISTAPRGRALCFHFQGGDFFIDKTLCVPSGLRLKFLGDGMRNTVIHWTGLGKGPMLAIDAPDSMSIEDLGFVGGNGSDGVVFSGIDHPGQVLRSQQLSLEEGNIVGLSVEGMRFCSVVMRDFYHSGAEDRSVVVGGRSDGGVSPLVAILGGASGNNKVSYDVSGSGKLFCSDSWYEGHTSGEFLRLSGPSIVTLQGCCVAAIVREKSAAFQFNDFRGRLSLLSIELNSMTRGERLRFALNGLSREHEVLALGCVSHQSGFFGGPSALALRNFGIVADREDADGGTVPVADHRATAPDFLPKMLYEARRWPIVATQGVRPSRLFLKRVWVSKCRVGVKLQGQ